MLPETGDTDQFRLAVSMSARSWALWLSQPDSRLARNIFAPPPPDQCGLRVIFSRPSPIHAH